MRAGNGSCGFGLQYVLLLVVVFGLVPGCSGGESSQGRDAVTGQTLSEIPLSPPAPPEAYSLALEQSREASVSSGATVPLTAGWNLIRFPVGQVTALTPGPGVASDLYAYDAELGTYVRVSMTAEAVNAAGGTARAFWVLASAASALEYDGTSGPAPVSLRAGWNLISPPGTVISDLEISTDSAGGGPLGAAACPSLPPAPGCRLYRFGFRYETGVGAYQHVDLTNAGTPLPSPAGMWVYAHEPATLTPQAPPKVVGLGVGAAHSMAVKSDGSVWTWGQNASGQLGLGTSRSPVLTPQRVPGLPKARLVTGGTDHSLALAEDGSLWAWGNNASGQLGDGRTGIDSSVPVQVYGLTGVADVVGGGRHTLALKPDGTVWAWGENEKGQCGQANTGLDYNVPVQVPGLSGIREIEVGVTHSMALKSDGTVWVWGDNRYGQLGFSLSAGSTMIATPTKVPALSGIVHIDSRGYHSLALTQAGTVRAWGSGSRGELGDGTFGSSSTPVQVLNLTGVSEIWGASTTSFALCADGTTWVWGSNGWGAFGNGYANSNWASPQRTFAAPRLMEVGYDHGVMLRQDDTVWAWGDNYLGQVGDGTLTRRTTPVQLPGL